MHYTSKEFIPSAKQQAYFDWVRFGSGNAIVVAVAGAGKTTTIVKGLDYMRGSIFIGAYNAKMAAELKSRVVGRTGVKAGTFHSAGLSALRNAYGKTYQLEVDDKKVMTIIDRYLVAEITAGNVEMRQYDKVIGPLCSFISMAKQTGIGALCALSDISAWLQMIEHHGLADDLPPEWDEYEKFIELVQFAQEMLDLSNNDLNTIDFNDMVYLPLQKNLRMWQNDWVLIDEAQDTNAVRRALAKRMLRPNGRLVAVGDPHQAIFGFTGADNDSLELIKQEFKCKELPLTITYRCPKVVVSHAQRWVSHIESATDSKEGQLIQIDYKDLISVVKPGDAILCRYNKYIVNLCFKLIKAEKPARIEGRAIGAGLVALAGKWKVRTLEELAKNVVRYQNKEVEKAIAAGKESKADATKDKCETLLVLIERGQEKGIKDIPALKEMIMSLFDDKVVDNRSMITLCSIHRSKGMEWPRVFILGRSEFQPSQMAQKDWQKQQEINLIYVAVTRAQETLYEVNGVKEESKQHSFGDAA